MPATRPRVRAREQLEGCWRSCRGRCRSSCRSSWRGRSSRSSCPGTSRSSRSSCPSCCPSCCPSSSSSRSSCPRGSCLALMLQHKKSSEPKWLRNQRWVSKSDVSASQAGSGFLCVESRRDPRQLVPQAMFLLLMCRIAKIGFNSLISDVRNGFYGSWCTPVTYVCVICFRISDAFIVMRSRHKLL